LLSKAEGWQTFCSIFYNTLFMYLLNTSNLLADHINELSFIMGIIITIAFYIEYKKCAAEIEKQDMLDHFLNDQ
jgi:hypothetical protein